MSCELRNVVFKNGIMGVSGDIRLPKAFDASKNYPAIVIATPGSSVKGQIGAVYGEKMAEQGFVTLAFDPSYQGQSEGEPRDLEDPAARVEDIRCAVDYLTTLEYVDQDRIGLLGICAGGGYAVNAALTEHRIKAVGTVVAVNIGRAMRQTYAAVPDGIRNTLEAVGKERSVAAQGGALRRDPWLPDNPEKAEAAGLKDRDMLDAVDFYRTPRGFDKHSTNRLLFRSNALLLGFDAFHLVGELLTQPLQVVIGGRLGSTGSFGDGKHLSELATNSKGFFVV
jgi:fermentation-respiration switch protein FrsA (DUF1100 family)